MRKLAGFLRRWAGRENGNATIEFCIWFPFFIGLVGSAFEASLITTRQALMIGALDRTVRDLQLGNLGNPTHAELKATICNTAGVIPDCANALHIEMERISTTDWAFRTGQVQCVDKDQSTEPAVNFVNGTTNDLMLITICAAIRTMVPVTGLGLKLPKINGGEHYAIIAYSAFVVEPA